MSRIVLLDTGPLGQVTHPKSTPANTACLHWFQNLLAQGNRVLIPEIADYELRRELLRAHKTQGLLRLDNLPNVAEYLSLTKEAMRQAAAFWAIARQKGYPTASDESLDADVILAAQADTLNLPNVVVATTNVRHLSRFVAADLWQNIV